MARLMFYANEMDAGDILGKLQYLWDRARKGEHFISARREKSARTATFFFEVTHNAKIA